VHVGEKTKYDVLYKDLRALKSIPFSRFVVEPLYFYARRVMLAITIVSVRSMPFFQLQLLVWQSLIAIMIHTTFNPYST